MKIPTSEKGPHTFLDEFQRTSEHFRYDEQHRSRETYTNSENVPVDELPKLKDQTLSDKKKQDQTQTVKLLTQHATTVAAVAATVTVVLPILPALTPTPEPAPLPEPTFTMEESVVGLDAYECALKAENVEGALTALLTTADGTILESILFPENGQLHFENLHPETEYTLRLQSEQAEELFSYVFTTDPFVQIVETKDSTVSELVLHESLPTSGDCIMTLYDTQGNETSAIGTSFTSSDGSGGGSSDSADSSSGYDETLSVRYYLFQAGIPEGEYVLRFIYYVDGVENFYEKTITAGTMTPFAFDATVDVNAGTIILQPTTGDLTPYQNQEFYVYMDQGSSSSSCYPTVKDGLLCLTFSSLQSGVAARIYLSVNYVFENVQFSAQIWIGEIQI